VPQYAHHLEGIARNPLGLADAMAGARRQGNKTARPCCNSATLPVALVLARGRPDLGGGGAVTAPKRTIEIGQVAEAGLEGDRADHVAGKTRVDQTTMHVLEPLIQHEVGERGAIALE
jgi:hypothetical protein